MNSWQTKKIGECLSICYGKNQSLVEDDYGAFPILGSGGEIGRAKEFLYNKPSVLIGRKGTIDNPLYMDQPFWTVDTLFYSKINSGYSPKFIYYLFKTINWRRYNEASGVPSLSAQTISQIKVVIPDLAEQERIVGVLGVWDEYLEKLERKIVLKEESKHSLIKKIFQNKDIGWSRDRLSSVADFINGYIFKSADYDKDGIFKVITIANVQSGKMTIGDGTNFIKHIPGDIQSDQILKIGDILISMTGNIGRVCLVDNENCLLNQRVGKILPKKIDRYFLYHQINNSKFISEMFRKSQGGAQDNLSVGAIMDHQIFIPEKTEQERIASILNDCDREIELLKSKKSQIEQQKKFLLKKLVSGELRTPEDILEKGVSR